MSDTKIDETAVRAGNATLTDRGSIYGDYNEGITVRCTLMKTLTDRYKVCYDKDMPAIYKEYLWDICNKLSRLAVTPSHIDSWHDIAGYSQLIENAIKQSGGVV